MRRRGWIMSVKLTDANLVMMSAAAQREDRCLTAPATMRDAAVSKVSAKLAKLGLLREIRAKAGTPAWHRDKAGQGCALKLTAAGLKAVVVVEGSEGAIESIDMTNVRRSQLTQAFTTILQVLRDRNSLLSAFEFKDITIPVVQECVKRWQDEGKSPSTINSRLSGPRALRSKAVGSKTSSPPNGGFGSTKAVDCWHISGQPQRPSRLLLSWPTTSSSSLTLAYALRRLFA
jgi:hypothetical protein